MMFNLIFIHVSTKILILGNLDMCVQIELARASEKKKFEEKAAEMEARLGVVRGDYERTIGQLRVELQKEFDKVARQQKDIEDLCKVGCILSSMQIFECFQANCS